FLFFKEFKLVAFDPGFARGIGIHVEAVHKLMLFLVVVTIVIGIQSVGVILMSALLTTPAVAARYWTDRLGVMVVLSGVFGLASGVVGTLFSSSFSGVPTGPIIILGATLLFLFSLFFSPSRGLLGRLLALRTVRKQQQQQLEGVKLYES
ncbi:MAG: metal ABC transporter permease, partial [Bacilli bacterium]